MGQLMRFLNVFFMILVAFEGSMFASIRSKVVCRLDEYGQPWISLKQTVF